MADRWSVFDVKVANFNWVESQFSEGWRNNGKQNLNIKEKKIWTSRKKKLKRRKKKFERKKK